MSIAPLVPLLVILGFVGLVLVVTAAGLRVPGRVEARRARRATERSRSLRELLSVLPLRQAVQRELRRGQAALEPLHAKLAHRREVRERAERTFEQHGRAAIDAPDHLIAWLVVHGILTVLWVVVISQHFLLETQVINTLTTPPGSTDTSAGPLEYALATVAVAITVGLGLLLAERVRPSGAIPAWKEKAPRDRVLMAAGLGAALLGIIAIYALVATARADAIHGPRVDATENACAIARADAAAAPDAATRSLLTADSQTACAEAERAASRHQDAQLWDMTVTVLGPVGEIVFGTFALHFLMVLAAGSLRARVAIADRRIGRAERALRQKSVAFHDRIVDVITAHPDVDPDEADAYINEMLGTVGDPGAPPPGSPAPGAPAPDAEDDDGAQVDDETVVDLRTVDLDDARGPVSVPLGDLAGDDPEPARPTPRPDDIPDAV